MSFAHAVRRPVSTRHAFALAFDLAFRRDALHSVAVPFLLRAPWILALLLLPSLREGQPVSATLVLSSVALLGGSISWWAVDAMLRVRARSVYGLPNDHGPAPALECYETGLRRLPWLYAAECVRGFALFAGFGAFFVPGVWLGYKLTFCTEAVVLENHGLSSAFQHSFRLARGRFERWLEMVVVSGFLALAVLFLGTVAALLVRGLSWNAWKNVTSMMLVALWPVFQYAWTFFYLRLIEVEEPRIIEVGPFYAAASTPVKPPASASGSGLALMEPEGRSARPDETA